MTDEEYDDLDRIKKEVSREEKAEEDKIRRIVKEELNREREASKPKRSRAMQEKIDKYRR